MRTTSVWGRPGTFFRHSIAASEVAHAGRGQACIVGCSDGKFVLPLVRRGWRVVGYDLDAVALFGGKKAFPVRPATTPILEYVSRLNLTSLPAYPTEQRETLGLVARLDSEGCRELVEIRHVDFYRVPTKEEYELVFTSCSIQYKSNRDLEPNDMVLTLTGAVKLGGFFSMEYMMPLEDDHHWKVPHFFRPGILPKLLPESFDILHTNESLIPSFDAAHVDRPADHFHRIGKILARRVS